MERPRATTTEKEKERKEFCTAQHVNNKLGLETEERRVLRNQDTDAGPD